MPHIGDKIPAAEWAIKEALENMQTEQQNFITYPQYQQLCNEKGLNKADSQELLIKLLHDLGVILHYHNDTNLKDIGVLNPEWVTAGVYAIITNKTLADNQGVLNIEDVESILASDSYPRERHLFIIEMMRKFELIFDFEGLSNQRFLIPDLLSRNEPDISITAILKFQYRYNFLPDSIISRFIVRIHPFIYRYTYWRRGVVLVKNRMQAIVKTSENSITITLSTNSTSQDEVWNFMGRIRSEFDHIHQSFQGLEFTRHISIPDDTTTIVDYDLFCELLKEHIKSEHIRLHGKFVKINVLNVLSQIDPPTISLEKIREQEVAEKFDEYLQYLAQTMHPQQYHLKILGLGYEHHQNEQYTLARQALVIVHEGVQRLRGMQGKNETQQKLSEQSADLHETLVHCYQFEGQIEDAFRFAATGKGRAFVAQLAKQANIIKEIANSDTPFAELLRQAHTMRTEIEQLEERIGNGERLQQKYANALRDENDLWQRMAKEDQVLAAMLSVPILDVKDAQTLANELDATLVEFYRHADGWCAFVIQPDKKGFRKPFLSLEEGGIQYITLPDLTDSLIRQLIQWRNDLNKPAGRSGFSYHPLEKMYTAIIEPLQLQTEHVIIAPFAELHLLPLTAARRPKTKTYLMHEHIVSFVPSLTALHVLHRQTESKIGLLKSMLTVAYPGEGKHRLPHVIAEAEAIRKRLHDKVTIKQLHNEHATPHQVISHATKYDVIHFGCHGRFDTDHPHESGLHLAPDEKQKSFLTVQQIISKLDLKQTRLATLAACLTGRVKL